MYETKNNICLKYIADLFQMANTKFSLRNKEFAMPRFNTTTHGKYSIRYIGPKVWSLIPQNIRDLPALFVFRQRIRKLDLNPYWPMLNVLIVFYVLLNRHFSISLSLCTCK